MVENPAITDFPYDDEYIIVESPELQQNGSIIDLNNLPKVSFCIPTLNNEDTIEKCLSSIANQDYPSVEIIIVDGNSKDKTIEIAKKNIPVKYSSIQDSWGVHDKRELKRQLARL